MVLLAQKHQTEIVMREMYESSHNDLSLVTSDGVFTTNKFLLLNIIPQISKYLPEFIINFDIITIIYPDISIGQIREAFDKLFRTGDPHLLEQAFGFVEADYQITMKNNEHDINEHDFYKHDKNVNESDDKAEMQINVENSVSIITENNASTCKMLEEVFIKEEQGEEDDRDSKDVDKTNKLNIDVPKKATKPKISKCNKCNKTFRDNGTLKRHEGSFHSKVLTCDRCDERLLGIDSYRQHRVECLFHCEKCGKTSERLDKMEAHRRAHSREEAKNRPYVEKITLIYK